jgi:hypothetical protein
MLTVVDELEPEHPRNWNEAAASCISEILEQISRPLAHMQKEEENIKTRIVSSNPYGPLENDLFLNSILEGLSMIDNHFEGMVQNMNWFESDPMYWVEEWKNLGSIAAAAGIKNGDLLPLAGEDHPENTFFSASAAGADNIWKIEDNTWRLQDDLTSTLIRKQSDYGHNNIARFGRQGLIVRCHDKVARLKNLHLSRAGQAANESIADTYTDIIGYSAIGMMWERGWFLLNLTKNT